MVTHDAIEHTRWMLDRIEQRVYAFGGTTIYGHEQVALARFLPIYWLRKWDLHDKRVDKHDFATLKNDFEKGVAKAVAQALTGSIT